VWWRLTSLINESDIELFIFESEDVGVVVVDVEDGKEEWINSEFSSDVIWFEFDKSVEAEWLEEWMFVLWDCDEEGEEEEEGRDDIVGRCEIDDPFKLKGL